MTEKAQTPSAKFFAAIFAALLATIIVVILFHRDDVDPAAVAIVGFLSIITLLYIAKLFAGKYD